MTMTAEELQKIAEGFASKLDLSKFKGDIVLNKQVENEINNVEPGGVGIQIVNNSTSEQACEPEPQPEPEPSPKEQPISDSELSEGTIDQHKQAFCDAMFKVQNIPYEQEKYKKAIARSYHWYGALRLAKDIGLLSGYDDLVVLMGKGKFEHLPKNPQNFSKYSKHICPEPLFPDWKLPEKASDPYFRRFLFIAEHTYKLYVARCHSLKIRPFGTNK